MAYADTINTGRTLKAGAAVLVFEVGLAAALIAGLTYTFTPKQDRPPPITFNVPKDPPPPPPPQDPVKPQVETTAHRLPVPPIPDLGDPREVVVVDLPPGTGKGVGEVTFPRIETPPPPPPQRPGIKARPRGNPGLWVSENDYPTSDLRAGHEGVTRFRLRIGSDGRVKDCAVTESSGYDTLDAAACAKLTSRARFDPASDGTGALVEGSYASSIRWKITNP